MGGDGDASAMIGFEKSIEGNNSGHMIRMNMRENDLARRSAGRCE